jgi:hypothetical protein
VTGAYTQRVAGRTSGARLRFEIDCVGFWVTSLYEWFILNSRSWNSSVSVVTWLRAGRSSFSFHAGARHFSPHQNGLTGCRAHPASYSMVTGVSFRGGCSKRGVKLTIQLQVNKRRYIPLRPADVSVAHRNCFIFPIFLTFCLIV